MIRHVFEYLTLACLMTITATSLSADDYEDFRTKYETEARKISESMEHAKGHLRIIASSIDRSGRRNVRAVSEGEFAVSGENGKVVLEHRIRRLGLNSNPKQVLAQLGREYYRLSNTSGTAFILENEGTLDQIAPGAFPVSEFDLNFGRILRSSYRFMNTNILLILDSPHREKPEFSRFFRDGKEFVRIRSVAKNATGGEFRFELEPASHYRLTKLEHKLPAEPGPLFEVEYDPNNSSSFVPKRVKYQFNGSEDIFEFTNVRLEPTPPDEFRYAFFGVEPNSDTKTQAGVRRTWSLVLGGAIASFFMLIIFRKRNRTGLTPVTV